MILSIRMVIKILVSRTIIPVYVMIGPCQAQWLLTSAHNVTDTCSGNNILMSVGWNSGGIQTSSDGVGWIQKSTRSGKRICFGGGYFWIITPDNEVIKTADGTNLLTTQTSFFADDIAYGNGRLVTISSTGGIKYSPDGTNWNTSLVPISSFTDGQVFFANNMFVAATLSGYLMTSSDGTTWAIKATNIYSAPKTITYGSNGFIVISHDGTKSWKSSDGNVWTSLSSGPGFYVNALHFTNEKYFAAGNQGKISVSSDGITWSPQVSGVTFKLEALCSIGQIIVAGGTQVIRNTVSTTANPSPNLTALPAIEIKFKTINGIIYTIEGSTNLNVWATVESGIPGNGGEMRRLYSTENQPYRFYRVKWE